MKDEAPAMINMNDPKHITNPQILVDNAMYRMFLLLFFAGVVCVSLDGSLVRMQKLQQ